MPADACTLCNSVRLLAEQYDESRARELIPALNRQLKDLRALLTKSKTLSRDIQYRITLSNERTIKTLSVDSVDLAPVDRVCETFGDNPDDFWTSAGNAVHVELRRRLACVLIFLRSKLEVYASVTPHLIRLFPGQPNVAHLRNSGNKYIKIARKLGGLGALFWLPLSIPHSTWERYLNLDDEDVFSHLMSLGPQVDNYTEFVRRLISCQLRDSSLSVSYYNLAADHADVLSATDQLLLLIYVLGGSNIPDIFLHGVRFHQRRWNDEGEVASISAAEFGLPAQIVHLLSDDTTFRQTIESPCVMKSTLEDGTIVWSLHPEVASCFSNALLPQVVDQLGSTALRLICFNCPLCYEGNSSWPESLRKVVWPILRKAATSYKMQTPLRVQVLEAVLYFNERGSVIIRRDAVEQARKLLRKSMPYYLHASVTLFQSVIYRIEGEFAKAEAQICDFTWKGPKPTTRRDYALQGRLHISQIENKIKCFDTDTPSFIYKWEAKQPLSTLDMEVTFRLQSSAARFFQSVGDFEAARSSLEQFLCLDTSKPIRPSTRRILVCRLADIYCEMQEFGGAMKMLQRELGCNDNTERSCRGFRKILLASVEANIGLSRYDAAESMLKEMEDTVPFAPEDLHDQLLHMRRLLAAARITHMQADPGAAVMRWKFALEEVGRMYTLKSRIGFTAAVIYLSLAHAQLQAGDKDGAQSSWVTGLEILRTERCEFWIPVVSTTWLQRIATEIHRNYGWYFRIMLPGGKPDIVFL